MLVPVMKPPASEHSRSAAPTRSSGSPARPIGLVRSMVARQSVSLPLRNRLRSVSISPGAKLLMVTPVFTYWRLKFITRLFWALLSPA